jgi:hypothetical protein
MALNINQSPVNRTCSWAVYSVSVFQCSLEIPFVRLLKPVGYIFWGGGVVVG